MQIVALLLLSLLAAPVQPVPGWEGALVPASPYASVALSKRLTIGDTFDRFLPEFGPPALLNQNLHRTMFAYQNGQLRVTFDER